GDTVPGGQSINTNGGQRFQVGLNAGTGAAVRSCDAQRDRRILRALNGALWVRAFVARPARLRRGRAPPWRAVAPYHLRAIIPNRFDRTAFHRFFAESFFLWRLWLFIDIGMATVIIPLEVCGRGFAA